MSTTVVGGVGTVLTYSTFDEIATLSYSYGVTPLFAEAFERDALGRIETRTETVGGVTSVYEYEYDGAGRLDTVVLDGVEAFDAGYDANGNRTSLETSGGTRVASHDAQDRLTEDGDFEFTFNEAGELETRTDTSTSDVTTYAYHELGGLLAVDLPDGTEIRYTLDGLQRRIAKEVDGVVERGWVYGAEIGPVAELDGTGAVVSRFVYGVRAHVPDYVERGGVTYRLVTDHLGSVRLVVDVATGAIAQQLAYDPWGVVTQDTSPGFQPFGYVGGLYDPDTGLVRFGERDYDPYAGRWTTKDPIGFGGGDPNLYVYAAGDPVNLTDPSGLISTLNVCLRNPALCAEAGILGGGLQARGQQIFNAVHGGVRALGAACGGGGGGGLTGQIHHAISRVIYRAIQQRPVLQASFAVRDPRFITQAADKSAHWGYQAWHRLLDARVADRIMRGNFTAEELKAWLRELYASGDLLHRFPNGLP